MKRSGTAKFPNSVQLFKFCQKVLTDQRGKKVRDQEVGAILGFNPSDCSHWKRGEKNVRSVFALARLAEQLHVSPALIHDLASGQITLEEALFEYAEARSFKENYELVKDCAAQTCQQARDRVHQFVAHLHEQADFVTPPLYLPEVMRMFSFISVQQVELRDRLSRILRTRPGQYLIQYKKGELRPHTRMSMAKDFARIIFEGERERFPELGALDKNLVSFEEMIFVAELLVPQAMLAQEMEKFDIRNNLVAECASVFWVPKSLVSLQMQEMIRYPRSLQAAGTQSLSKEHTAGNQAV